MPDHIFLLSPFGRTSRGGSRAQVPAALSFSHHGGRGARDLVPDGPAQRGRGIHGQYVYWTTMSHPRPETVQQLSLRTLALLPAPPSCLTAPELRPTALEAGARAADPPTTPRSPLRRAYLSAPLRPPPYHFTASTRLVDRKVYKIIPVRPYLRFGASRKAALVVTPLFFALMICCAMLRYAALCYAML